MLIIYFSINPYFPNEIFTFPESAAFEFHDEPGLSLAKKPIDRYQAQKAQKISEA